MMGPLVVRGVAIPRLMYGTAWKEERTAPLVREALRAGFRGIDTANQRKHYHEAAVGEAVREALASGTVQRGDLFIQTKFTYPRGQDHRLPYDPEAPPAKQVAQSFERSIEHLGVDAIDALLLHGPSTFPGLSELDHETWRAMEAIHDGGRVRLLGVSNVTPRQLEEIHQSARVKPALVQNRTFTRPAADGAVRAFCAEHGLGYEGFSLLTAIPQALQHAKMRMIAQEAGKTPAEVLLRWCLEQGMVVLTGTTSPAHMAEDLGVEGWALPASAGPEIARLVGAS